MKFTHLEESQMEICETDKHAIDNTCMALFKMLHTSDIDMGKSNTKFGISVNKKYFSSKFYVERKNFPSIVRSIEFNYNKGRKKVEKSNDQHNN